MTFRKLILTFAVAGVSTAMAQYPTIPSEIKATAEAKKAAADKRSDEAFEKALPAILEGEKNGKPYRPWASHPMDLVQEKIPAFPGAEGGGMYTAGGRGGKVFVVTSLEDAGPGTFREACEAGGPRIVVFNVAGVIRLKDRIRIRAPYITINGATAPGDGVCIAGNTVELESHDIIVRHMRFRRGETDMGDRNDSIGGNPTGNVMIDHVSASWGLDENMSMYRHMTDVRPYLDNPYVRSKYRDMHSPKDPNVDLKLPTVNITIQNSIFSEGLNTYHHAFGSTVGGRNSTLHHNLWACNTGRNPSIGMDGDFTLANNVIFNWRHRTVDGGDHLSNYNLINNYFKPGPATPSSPISHRLLKPEQRRGKGVPKDYGRAYVNGNVVEGNDAVTQDNWNGGVQVDLADNDGRDPKEILAGIRVERPFSTAPFTVTSAQEAYVAVLATVGATHPVRDAVDARVIETVRTGQPTAKPHAEIEAELSQAGYTKEKIAEQIELVSKGIITNPIQVGGYPEYKGTPYTDADGDGMDDAWELKVGLDPANPADAAKDMNGDGYTNIEDFLNGTDPKAKVDWTDLRNNIDPRKAPKPQVTSN